MRCFKQNENKKDICTQNQKEKKFLGERELREFDTH